jgi:hypothetical protein
LTNNNDAIAVIKNAVGLNLNSRAFEFQTLTFTTTSANWFGQNLGDAGILNTA